MQAQAETGTVVAVEMAAETRSLIEDTKGLAEDLRLHVIRLEELLAPSEVGLKARDEYLERLTRERWERTEQRTAAVAQQQERIAREQKDLLVQLPQWLADIEARRWGEIRRREQWRTVLGFLAMLLGGFLAGQAASWRASRSPAACRRRSWRRHPRRAFRRRLGLAQTPAPRAEREEIANSADLARRYASEYASMLRAVVARDVAKEAPG